VTTALTSTTPATGPGESAAPELQVALPAPLLVEVFSDLICPWCYIGSQRLTTALIALAAGGGLPGGRAVQVLWQPFELNPEMPVGGRDRREYRSAKFGSWAHSQQLDADVTAAGAADGLVFRHDVMQRTPNTRAGHRLVWLAQEQGLGQQIVHRLFAAYFAEGLDVGDPEVLTCLAAEGGMDATQAREAVTGTGEHGVLAEAAVAAALQRGRDLQISGVPFYVIGEAYGLFGAQPADTLVQLLNQVNSELHPAADTSEGTPTGVCSTDGTCS
jgi:predicted DsbA family dithiol-disulfide isomerase